MRERSSSRSSNNNNNREKRHRGILYINVWMRNNIKEQSTHNRGWSKEKEAAKEFKNGSEIEGKRRNSF